MTVLAWPSGVPKSVLRDGFARVQPSPVQRSEMDVGAKQRAVALTAPRRLEVRLLLTSAQLAAFDAWWGPVARFGTVPFAFTDPVTSAAITVRAIGGQEVPLAPHPRRAGAWLLSLSLEVLAEGA